MRRKVARKISLLSIRFTMKQTALSVEKRDDANFSQDNIIHQPESDNGKARKFAVQVNARCQKLSIDFCVAGFFLSAIS